ncbi:hypothetical protein P5W04_10370 [Mycobacteroides abscessus subsp. abscessus]|uniref:hypothetical protein n=1 Tax=Mycobacteroides abscessus TaxID=36809 RepID=UPI0011C3698E|nr:hypothetical protein [Mycobacteroides abscessus]MBN7484539.1 hypothetical protein [Mycobacteroides abscessus subsp. abscessus]MDO3240519.1 hypothetical protein [Mycobacteroides abscessus subsp. abscessus]
MTETLTPDANVVAVDVSPTTAYIARVYRDGRTPDVEQIVFAELDDAKDSNLTRAGQIAEENATRVVKAILAVDPFPSMVVMHKLLLFDAKQDPSGPRRSALWWGITQKLIELSLPVAEVAPMTAQKMITGRGLPGRAGFTDSERGVYAMYPELRKIARFRYYVVAEAITGAVALGWSTPAIVDSAKLRGLTSVAGSFPMEVPATVAGWDALNSKHIDAYDYPRNTNTNTQKGA